MILTGQEIANQVDQNRITISPYARSRCTTNSYDLALGRRLVYYTEEVLDPRREPGYEVREIPDEGYVLDQGEFVLAETVERFGSDHYVPEIHAKSGTARLGLFVHVTADLIDLGFVGQSTLQLYATLPVRIWPGMLIAQVTFWVPKGRIRLYGGKYQHADGPQISRSYEDHPGGVARD
ncbi:dCTP deaminase [Actinoalloteichus sp. GBA129-24]|uniref:dCTP deaminase n=1 Tax=Actinoalloteichus sp. GBA129-24 TaxID=1612551 RepID=UPI0009504C68|nr:dCTP deaminase [Actinoalloteichus sp. GBA129-24]APU21281.1 deoxycytidine triphosphate deaminase [Actinoalloteichus sp. GBA129-24]